jgi:putative acyl-CoA dehydrogenase
MLGEAPMHPNRFSTHEVFNQPSPLAPYDMYATDRALQEGLAREGGGFAAERVAKLGPVAGGELFALGFGANENKPRFRPFDAYGHRIDEVEFHPAYHRIMEIVIAHGVPSFAWLHQDTEGAHVARAVLLYLTAQAEQGHQCPLTMTYASIPTLRHNSELAATWIPRVLSTNYDPRFIPAVYKRGATIGMGMTEKQGGSDVRANTTRATPIDSDGMVELIGHKWFFSAPMCDAFLVLAQEHEGLSCFLLERFLPDGTQNALRIQRLKDKLGDWSNASSEVEFQAALATRVGAPGRGISNILDMVALTRLDCAIGSAAIMRQALVQVLHHARQRSVFGKSLVTQPLMQNVLADLALESEAALALVLRLARAVDAAQRAAVSGNAQDAGSEAAFARIVTAVAKYWICKRCPPFVNEAQECLGGAGYVEESILPRLYRQAPLNSIWEGSGNIQCLDVLRALKRDPGARDALFAELAAARGGHAAYDAALDQLTRELDETAGQEARARSLVERVALLLQAALLLRSAPRAVAELFCASRLGAAHGLAFGTLPTGASFEAILERALV